MMILSAVGAKIDVTAFNLIKFLTNLCFYLYLVVSNVESGDAATSPVKNLLGKID